MLCPPPGGALQNFNANFHLLCGATRWRKSKILEHGKQDRDQRILLQKKFFDFRLPRGRGNERKILESKK